MIAVASCSTQPPSRAVVNTSTSPSNITQFENRLVEKLLHLAFLDIEEADEADRANVIEHHQREVSRAVDVSRLSNHNQLQIRVLDKLLFSAQSKTDSPESRINQLIQDSTLGLDGEAMIQLASARLESLKSKLLLLKQTEDLASLLNSIRHDQINYQPNTESGRQEYLSLIVEKLGKMELLLPSLINLSAHKELSLMGFNKKHNVAVPVFNYDQETATLEIDLTDMAQLPRFEIESAALFYGVPGLHTVANTHDAFEIQSLAKLPAYTYGWAAYASSSLDRFPLYQHPTVVLERTYSEMFFIARAIADYAINMQDQPVNESIEFLGNNTPYPITRIENSVALISQNPGLYFGSYMGYLEFEALEKQAHESLQENYGLVKFHNHVLALGPLPFVELRVLINRWLYSKASAELK